MTATASVIIPTRDRGALVLEAIQSALETAGVAEVIVVDGGSTDGSLEELRRLGDRIRLVTGSFPNAAATRNAGVARAEGRYLAFLDSDDLMLPGKIACLTETLDADEAICLAHGTTLVIDADGVPDPVATAEQARQLAEGARVGTTYEALAEYCAMYTSATLIRRSAFEAVGGYDESLETYEDWDLYLRLAVRFRLVYAPCAAARYRIWAGNVAWNRTAAGLVAVAEKHLANLPPLHASARDGARYAFLRRLASANHILLDKRGTRRAALAAFRAAPARAVRDPGVRGPLLRSAVPAALLQRRRPQL